MGFSRTSRVFQYGIACALIAAFALPEAASANQFKRIRDVNVSCNNALLCDLYITNPRVTLQTFGFRRMASQTSDVSVYLSMREPLRAGTQVQFEIDGEIIADIPVSDFSYRAAIYDYSYRDQDVVLALLKAARAGDRVEISYTTKAGRSTAPFSLSGITAGMIFADEVQGRLDRDDALMAITGEGRSTTANDVGSSVSQFQTWGDVPEQLRVYFGTDNQLCSNVFGQADEQIFGGASVDLGSGETLVYLPCGTPGAYNFPSALWLIRGDYARRLALPVIGRTGPTIADRAWNIGWDSPTRTLTSFFKGRGLGDCGTYSEWTLDLQGNGPQFILKNQREKDRCDGVYEDDFSDYEQIWPQ